MNAKKARKSIFLLAAVLAAACVLPQDALVGSLSLSFSLAAARTAYPAPAEYQIASYSVHGDGPLGQYFDVSLDPLNTHPTIPALAVGRWTVTASALNGNATPIVLARGSATTTVVAGATGSVEIILTAADGVGVFALNFGWAEAAVASPDITVVMTDLNGSMATVYDQAPSAGSPISYVNPAFPAGAWRCVVTLRDGVAVAAAVTEAVQIFAGLTTTLDIDLPAECLNHPPEAPTGLSAVIDGFYAIQLDWTDNALTESGFRIQRYDDVLGYIDIAEVAPNVATYRDENLKPNVAYQYFVRAANGFGDSAPAASDSLSIPLVANPVIVNAQEIDPSEAVEITCATGGASIRYTLDGSDPAWDTGTLYAGPFTLAAKQKTEVRAMAYMLNAAPSAVVAKKIAAYPKAASAYMAAGSYHTLFVKANGSVWTIGNNNSGELGDGTNNTRTNYYNVIASGGGRVAAGNGFSLMLKEDNTLWGFGTNGSGQLGLGPIPQLYNTPTQITGIGGTVLDIQADNGHSLVLTTSGYVYSTGLNGSGQLGHGNIDSYDTFTQIAGLSQIIAIDAGYETSIALQNDGTVWTFGDNGMGQSGNGTTGADVLSPYQVPSLSSIIAVAAGRDASFAISSSGLLYAWGTGPMAGGGSPTPSVIMNDVESVVAGSRHVIVTKTDGSVWAWGYNDCGQLGLGDTTTYNVPTQVTALADLVAIAGGYSHTHALAMDGTLWSFGENASAHNFQLGLNGGGSFRTVPGLSAIVDAAAGDYFTLALRAGGDVYSFGNNEYGALGLGDTANRYEPTLNTILKTNLGVSAVKVYASNSATENNGHSMVLGDDGLVYAFGSNYCVKLGIGSGDTGSPFPTPTPIASPTGVAFMAVNDHSLFVTAGGDLYGVGSNAGGQLTSSYGGQSSPVALSSPTPLKAVAAGTFHSLMVTTDGRLFAVGDNEFGQFGNGNFNDSLTAIQVGTGTDWSAVASGAYHNLALKADGSLWSCGSNDAGQLGLAIFDDPVFTWTKVGTGNDWTAISAAGWHSFALKANGDLYAFGDNNEDGCLGISGGPNSPVLALSGVRKVATGLFHTVAVMRDGTVRIAGARTNGLGTGQPENQTLPAKAGIMGLR